MSKKRGLFISASAGTGKTTRLIEEYIKVFEKNRNLDIDNVVAITFTRKAAKEMKERIRKKITEKYEEAVDKNKDTEASKWLDLRTKLSFAWISTIHSFCERILKENAIFIPIDPSFQVLTGIRYNTILERQVIRYLSRKLEDPKNSDSLEKLLKLFSLNKTVDLFKKAIASKRYEVFLGDVNIDDSVALVSDSQKSNDIKKAIEIFKDSFNELLEDFRNMLFEEAKLDFETILFETLQLLEKKEFIRRRYIQRFKYIFVDEFQDTNELQKKIIDLLHDPKENFLLFVGDPKQSIYRFRGADVTVFTKTERYEFEESQKERLQVNYRSHPDLVEFFNRFFPHVLEGGNEFFKILYQLSIPTNDTKKFEGIKGKRVKILNLNEEMDGDAKSKEARLIARFIISRVKRKENSFKDFVILLRKFKGEVDHLTRVFDEYSIPYYAVSGGGFYDRPEISGILSFLTILNDPLDNEAFTALLLSPFFRLTFDEIMKLKGSERKIYDAILKSEDEKFKRFVKIHSEYMKLKEIIGIGELVEMIINDTGYLAKLAFMKNPNRMIANVKKFVEISKDLSNEGYSLREFVSQMKRYSPDEESEASIESEEDDVVRIMTIHKSKGLQFPVVILPRIFATSKNNTADIIYDDNKNKIYLNPLSEKEIKDGVLENLYRTEKSKDLEEEKRILYVAMTRAEKELVLCGVDSTRGSSPWGAIFKSLGFYDSEVDSWMIPEEFEDLVEIIQSSSLPDEPFPSVEVKPKPVVEIPESVYPLRDKAKRVYISPTQVYGEISIDEVLQLDEVLKVDKRRDMGILVHEIMEQVGSKSLKGTVTTLKALRRAKPRLVDDVNFSEEDLKIIWQDLERWFENSYIHQIENSEKCYSELSVSRKFKDRILYGIIDKIFLYNGEWIIADFKYANYNPKSEEKYKFQLLFYVYATQGLFKPSPKKALLFYLKERGDFMVKEYNFKAEDIERFESELEKKIAKFEKTIKEWEMGKRYTLGQADFRSLIG